MWKPVGMRISQLRKDRNLSRAQFGNMIGLTEQYIGKIERGTNNISGDIIAKLCVETGVSADYILFGITDYSNMKNTLNGLSHEQIEIAFDIIKRVAQFINTEDGNNALIREILHQQKAGI